MDEREAQELARRIQREAPHLIVKAAPDVSWGQKTWIVYVYAEGLNEPLQIENPEEWEVQKAPFLLPRSSTNS